MTRLRLIFLGVALPSIVAGMAALAAAPALGAPPPGTPGRTFSRPVCPGPVHGAAGCHSRVVADRKGTPLATAAPTGYGPAQFRGAYELPTAAPAPQTIAIVDAYDDPTIEEDLAVYDETYGLPECTTANGCFRKVNQEGQAGPYPKADGGWALEISLDVEIAHAICQDCKVVLVEASSAFFSDLTTAVNTAAGMGATEISNSYGGGEYAGEVADTSYRHPGIAITASAGDEGYGAEYPAASPYVVAVGGTRLEVGASNGWADETVWSGTGSGCSAYVTAQAWQVADPNWSLTGCGSKRAIADVAADAAPATGASVYDTTKYKGQSGWFKVGGTSLSAPLIAGVYALAGGGSGEFPAAGPYAHQEDSPASLRDVTEGSNGSCGGSIVCTGASGYDGPTGVGTPKGIAAFAAAAPEPEEFGLTVSRSGEGSGTVSSEPAGIDCGAECSAEYDEGTEVTLEAEADEGSAFAGWSGAGCSGTGVCAVTMSEPLEVTADFEPEAVATVEFPLRVTIEGGEGTVASSPGGILCGVECEASFEQGSEVTLTASPAPGYAFKGWKHCDIGGVNGRQCMVTMSEAKEVTAHFVKIHKLTVARAAGSGPGKVASHPVGVSCLPSCSSATAAFEEGTAVSVVPTPAKHFHFTEWSGDCFGGGSCSVSMNADHAVEASFAEDPKFALTVSKASGGQGKVSSRPAGVACLDTCSALSADFYEGEEVVLSEVPGKGSAFAGWTGCDGVDEEGRCLLTMDEAKQVEAEFE